MRSLILLIAAFISGCSVHNSQVSSRPVELPGNFLEAPGPALEKTASGKYWHSFNDETLNVVVEETLANNLDIARAAARLSQLEAAARVSGAARLPFLNLTGRAGRERQISMFGSSHNDIHSLSLAAGYEIDFWKKIKNTTDAAKLRAFASKQDLRALYISISAQAADLYYLMVEQRAQLTLTNEIISSYHDTLERIESRYREGLVPALDVYQARQNILAAQIRKPAFEKNLAIAAHGLSILGGRFPEKAEVAGLADLPDIDRDITAGIPAQLLSARPDVEAAFLRLKAKDADVAAAIAERFPSFNIMAAVTEPGISGSDLLWNVILEAVQPLFDGGRRRAGVDIKKAEFDEELANYKQVLLRAVKEVEDALASRRTTLQRIELLTERIDVTGATLRLATDQYFEGLSDYLQVLTAQVIHFEVQSQLLSARKELISDHISLMRALGGNWMDSDMAGNNDGEATRS